jgi:heme/copper-type cytochrome/quinol oxidase subunit 3
MLASSATLLAGQRAIARGNRDRLEAAVGATLTLGLLFLAVQSSEFVSRAHDFGPDRNAYASLLYAITGLHAAHAVFGVLLLGWTLARTMRAEIDRRRHVTVEVTALYWHFVVAIWVLNVLVLYLSPRL